MSVELLGLPLGLPSPSSQVRFDPRISRLKPHLRLLPRPFAARDLSLYRKEPPHPVSISRDAGRRAGKTAGALRVSLRRFPITIWLGARLWGGEKRAKTPSNEARAAHTVSIPSKRSLALQTRRFLLSLRRRPPPCPLPRGRATMRAPHKAARTHKSAPSVTRGGAAASGTHSPARRACHAARAPSNWPEAAHGAPRGWRGIAIVAARAGGWELEQRGFLFPICLCLRGNAESLPGEEEGKACFLVAA